MLTLAGDGHIVEGDLDVPFLIVAARLALADAHAHESAGAAATLLTGTPEQPDVKPDDQDRRTEPEQQRQPGAAAGLDRLGADLHLVGDQQGLEPGIHEHRDRGRKPGDAAWLVAGGSHDPGVVRCSLGGRRIGHCLPEAALEVLALAVDRLDIPRGGLGLEDRIGYRDRRVGPREEVLHQQVVQGQDDQKRQPGTARRQAR